MLKPRWCLNPDLYGRWNKEAKLPKKYTYSLFTSVYVVAARKRRSNDEVHWQRKTMISMMRRCLCFSGIGNDDWWAERQWLHGRSICPLQRRISRLIALWKDYQSKVGSISQHASSVGGHKGGSQKSTLTVFNPAPPLSPEFFSLLIFVFLAKTCFFLPKKCTVNT